LNPASEYVSIKFQNTIKFIIITGINGSEYLKINPNETNCQIDISSLPTGIYFITIDTGDKVENKKLIIVR
jgi:hypothetical protein